MAVAHADSIASRPGCVLLAGLVCVGCGAGPQAQSITPAAPAALRAHTLVWATAAEDAPPSTYALADDGAVVSRTEVHGLDAVARATPLAPRGLGAPPRAVGLFVDAHPGLTVGGYSAIP